MGHYSSEMVGYQKDLRCQSYARLDIQGLRITTRCTQEAGHEGQHVCVINDGLLDRSVAFEWDSND